MRSRPTSYVQEPHSSDDEFQGSEPDEIIEWKDKQLRVGSFVYFKEYIGCIHNTAPLEVCIWVRPAQTVHRHGTRFIEREVFKTNNVVEISPADITGVCVCLHIKDYIRGSAVEFAAEDTWCCESRYNDGNKAITKIKNWSSCLPAKLEIDIEPYENPLVLARNSLPEDDSVSVKPTRRQDAERPKRRTEEKEHTRRAKGYKERPDFLVTLPTDEKFSKQAIAAAGQEGVIRWFATPPVYVEPVPTPKHSKKYLDFKAKKQPTVKNPPTPKKTALKPAVKQQAEIRGNPDALVATIFGIFIVN